MAIDPNEKLVYLSVDGQRPFWWESGLKVPQNQPRDIRWPMPDTHGSVLMITLDLRTCQLFARFVDLCPESEADITCRPEP